MSKPIAPRVHLNGTSRAALEEGLQVAIRALGHAREAMQDAAPNARDYYVQGDGAFKRAVHEHGDRLTRVLDVEREMHAILEQVVDQG